MKYLKKPVIAILLSVIIVLSSGFLSARGKLSEVSGQVTEGFYQGIKYDGYKHKSAAAQLERICGAVSGLITIARNYGIDTSELFSLNSELSRYLSEKTGSISSVYACYAALSDSLSSLCSALSEKNLSTRDAKGMKEYNAAISSAEKGLRESGYNESVYEFRKDMSRFPTNFFLSVTHTQLPEIFG